MSNIIDALNYLKQVAAKNAQAPGIAKAVKILDDYFRIIEKNSRANPIDESEVSEAEIVESDSESNDESGLG